MGPRTRSGARTTVGPSCHHERPSGQGKGEEAGREVRTCYGQGRPMTPVVNRLARCSLVLPTQVQCHIAITTGHLPASTYIQTCQAEPRLGRKIAAILATNLDLPPDPPVLTRIKLRCTSHLFFISTSFFGQARMHRTGPVEPSVRGTQIPSDLLFDLAKSGSLPSRVNRPVASDSIFSVPPRDYFRMVGEGYGCVPSTPTYTNPDRSTTPARSRTADPGVYHVHPD